MESNYSYCSLSKKTVSGGNCRKSGRLSTDPQSVAARERRHRISDRFKILQSMVPGGTKMDTVSMLDEAIQYVKFLKAQIWLHQRMINDCPAAAAAATGLHLPSPAAASDTSLFPSQYPDHFGAVDNVYYFNNGGDHQSLLPPLPPELQPPLVPVPEQMSYCFDAYTINYN